MGEEVLGSPAPLWLLLASGWVCSQGVEGQPEEPSSSVEAGLQSSFPLVRLTDMGNKLTVTKGGEG